MSLASESQYLYFLAYSLFWWLLDCSCSLTKHVGKINFLRRRISENVFTPHLIGSVREWDSKSELISLQNFNDVAMLLHNSTVDTKNSGLYDYSVYDLFFFFSM